MIVTVIIFTIQIISYTHDFLSFKSHFEIKIQNHIYDSMRLPSFRLCFDTTSVSKFGINEERMKFNISRFRFILIIARKKIQRKTIH
jgi:hypothetical protein